MKDIPVTVVAEMWRQTVVKGPGHWEESRRFSTVARVGVRYLTVAIGSQTYRFDRVSGMPVRNGGGRIRYRLAL